MKNGCLYVKIFESGKMYVGVTNDFDRRMHQHEYDAFTRNSRLEVHIEMRACQHKTEIWADGIDDRELLNMLEVQTILQLKLEGISICNRTLGGDGDLWLGVCGENHPRSKPMSYYETTARPCSDFKRVCKRQGWDYNNFKEIDSGLRRGKTKKYYYVYMGEDYKKENKNKDKCPRAMKYKDMKQEDKINMVMSSLTGNSLLSNDNINISDYKKEITSVINKVKTILNIENIEPLQVPMYQDIIESAIDLPNNFNKMAGIKRALDVLEDVDLYFCTLVKQIVETGLCKVGTKEYTFVRDNKYVSKLEQEEIEREFLWLYNNSIKGKFDYDTFMKCIFKVEPSEDKKSNKIIGVLGRNELYLQGKIIKLH